MNTHFKGVQSTYIQAFDEFCELLGTSQIEQIRLPMFATFTSHLHMLPKKFHMKVVVNCNILNENLNRFMHFDGVS